VTKLVKLGWVIAKWSMISLGGLVVASIIDFLAYGNEESQWFRVPGIVLFVTYCIGMAVAGAGLLIEKIRGCQ